MPKALYVHNNIRERWFVSNDSEDPGLKCNNNGCLRKCLVNAYVNFAIGIENTHNQHKAETNKNIGAKQTKERKVINVSKY